MTEFAARRPPRLDELPCATRRDPRDWPIEEDRSLFDLGAFYADLEDLLGCEVDVGTNVKPRLRERVLAEAVPL